MIREYMNFPRIERGYFDITVQYVNHYATETL